MKRRKKCSIRMGRNGVRSPLPVWTKTKQQLAFFSQLCRIYWRYLMKWVSLGSKINGYQPRITMVNNFVKNTTWKRILKHVEGKIFQIRSNSCQHGQIRVSAMAVREFVCKMKINHLSSICSHFSTRTLWYEYAIYTVGTRIYAYIRGNSTFRSERIFKIPGKSNLNS